MNHQSLPGEKFRAFLNRTINANSKAEIGGLFPKIAESLIGGGDASKKGDVTAILRDLFALEKLDLPLDANKEGDFNDGFVTQASALLSGILTKAGRPELAIASTAGIELLRKFIESSCGQDTTAEKVSGLPVDNKNGVDFILYFVESKDRQPNLPLVDGSRMTALEVLEKGFKNWSRRLKLIVNMEAEQDKANLIVTSADLGKNSSVLARTEIGPPRGQQLRMVFNESKTFTRDEFESNVAHEFGHLLGVFHEDVDVNDQLLVMHGTLLGVKQPQDADLNAAAARGWTKKVV